MDKAHPQILLLFFFFMKWKEQTSLHVAILQYMHLSVICKLNVWQIRL